MQSLKYAYDIMQILKQAEVRSIYQQDDNFFVPKNDGSSLVEISEAAVVVNGASFNDRITPSKQSKLTTKIEVEIFKAFVADLSSASTVSLNHLGISYYCHNLEAEIARLQKLLGDNALYEEASGSSTTKWLFIGDTKRPSEPLFEFVLNQRIGPVLSSWTPHFQIDIDTALPLEELQEIIKKHFGDKWIKWSITVEGWGVPLVVGRLCSINGLKVYLAIGTNKRGREWHRKEGLRRL